MSQRERASVSQFWGTVRADMARAVRALLDSLYGSQWQVGCNGHKRERADGCKRQVGAEMGPA